jgi:hypothetical protein
MGEIAATKIREMGGAIGREKGDEFDVILPYWNSDHARTALTEIDQAIINKTEELGISSLAHPKGTYGGMPMGALDFNFGIAQGIPGKPGETVRLADAWMHMMKMKKGDAVAQESGYIWNEGKQAYEHGKPEQTPGIPGGRELGPRFGRYGEQLVKPSVPGRGPTAVATPAGMRASPESEAAAAPAGVSAGDVGPTKSPETPPEAGGAQPPAQPPKPPTATAEGAGATPGGQELREHKYVGTAAKSGLLTKETWDDAARYYAPLKDAKVRADAEAFIGQHKDLDEARDAIMATDSNALEPKHVSAMAVIARDLRKRADALPEGDPARLALEQKSMRMVSKVGEKATKAGQYASSFRFMNSLDPESLVYSTEKKLAEQYGKVKKAKVDQHVETTNAVKGELEKTKDEVAQQIDQEPSATGAGKKKAGKEGEPEEPEISEIEAAPEVFADRLLGIFNAPKEGQTGDVRKMLANLFAVAKEELGVAGKGAKQKDWTAALNEVASMNPNQQKIWAGAVNERLDKLYRARKSKLAEAGKDTGELDDIYKKLKQELSGGPELMVTRRATQQAMRQQLKAAGIKMTDVIKESRETQQDILSTLTSKLVAKGQEAGVAKEMASNIADAYNTALGDARRSWAKQFVKNMEKRGVKLTRKNKTVLDKIVELDQLGLLDDESLYALTGQYLGLPTFTSELASKVRTISKQIQSLPDNSIEKDEAFKELQKIWTMYEDKGLAEKVKTAYRMSPLFSVRTALRNLLPALALRRTEKVANMLASGIDLARSSLTGKDRMITFRTGDTGNAWKNYLAGWGQWGKATKAGLKAGMEGQQLGSGMPVSEAVGGLAFKPAEKGAFTEAVKSGNVGGAAKAAFQNAISKFEGVTKASLSGLDYGSFWTTKNDVLRQLGYLDARKQGLRGPALDQHVDKFVANADEAAVKIAEDVANKVRLTDDNIFSKLLIETRKLLNRVISVTPVGVKVGRGYNPAEGGFGAGDIAVLYAQTPGALIMRSFEYSPFGIYKSLIELGKTMARVVPALKNKEALKTTDIDIRELEQGLGRAIVGTAGLTGLGLWLHHMGVLTAKDEDNNLVRSFERDVKGKRNYVMNFSAARRLLTPDGGNVKDKVQWQKGDLMVGYDWIQPAAASIAVGAELDKALIKEKGRVVPGFARGLAAGTQSLLDQPVMTIFSKVFGSGGRKPLEAFGKRVANILIDVPATFVPAFAQVARQLADPTVRQTYSPNPAIESWNKLVAKIPFASKTLPAMVSHFSGDKARYDKDKGAFWNAMGVGVIPWVFDKYNIDPVAEAVLLSYQKTGATEGFPKEVPKTLEYDGGAVLEQLGVIGANKKMTAEQQAEALKELGFRDVTDKAKVQFPLKGQTIEELQALMGKGFRKGIAGLERKENRQAWNRQSPTDQVSELAKVARKTMEETRELYLKRKARELIQKQGMPKLIKILKKYNANIQSQQQ